MSEVYWTRTERFIRGIPVSFSDPEQACNHYQRLDGTQGKNVAAIRAAETNSKRPPMNPLYLAS